MVKSKIFLNMDKEEKWLENMGEQGYELVKVGLGSYHFTKANSESTKIRVDNRKFLSIGSYEEYCTLFEDSGWKHIAGDYRSGNQYFKRIKVEAGDSLFSDVESNAMKYKRYSLMWSSILFFYISVFISLIITKVVDINKTFDFKGWYINPTLWELHGGRFWLAFLVETPFAIIRNCAGILFPILILVHGYCAMKTFLEYRRELRGLER